MFFTDLFFPKHCLGCSILGAYICPKCQKLFRYLDRGTCFYCKKSSLYGLTHPICLKNFNIDGVIAVFYYNNLLKKIIKNIKYRLVTEAWKDLTRTIKPEAVRQIGFYKRMSKDFFLQPIPLTRKKIRERGFNQAFLITKFFQKFLDFPISDFLMRVKETLPQAELKTKKDRYNNLRGAFKINPVNKSGIIGSKIILVDDVVTTGSTVREAAKALKKAGAAKIYVLALARG
ncbi:MAG: phosphoribosyltransferase family protein [Patescibacteria group bacterium]